MFWKSSKTFRSITAVFIGSSDWLTKFIKMTTGDPLAILASPTRGRKENIANIAFSNLTDDIVSLCSTKLLHMVCPTYNALWM